jgi:hypothetical protein
MDAHTPFWWFGVVFTTVGAGAVLFALAYVSTIIGVWLIGPMSALMAGPILDKVFAKK